MNRKYPSGNSDGEQINFFARYATRNKFCLHFQLFFIGPSCNLSSNSLQFKLKLQHTFFFLKNISIQPSPTKHSLSI